MNKRPNKTRRISDFKADHKFHVIRRTLTDGSKTYEVIYNGNGIFHCISQNDAVDLAQKMSEAINEHTNESAAVR